jgi:hypothetical protein
MKSTIQKSSILIITILIFFPTLCNTAHSDAPYKFTDIENLAHKQELTIPIDTSLKEAIFQPIDIKVDFSSSCWAKDETMHSVRVGYDNGNELIEIDSQIYDLEKIDESHISSCSLVFLIPEQANGEEKYYVLYDSSETQAPDYEDHLRIEDTNYFYEPISGQKIQFDYYGIFQDEYIIYAVIQKGEIVGNPVGHYISKCKPESKKLDTNYIDQLASFDFRHGISGEPDYTGSAANTEVKKSIIIDGNLMVRIKFECYSPQNDIKTDNIYTYYYCPTDTKRIFVNVNHDVIETINIKDPDVLDGIYSGLITIKSRSTTIDKMNVGYILPNLNLYDEDETIKEYSIPPNPQSVEKELILSTEDDVDLGSKAWISQSDPDTGKVHGLILEKNTGISNDEMEGIQIKAYVKQNIKLPGLEGDTGSVFFGRNAYESGGSHETVIPKGLNVNFGIVFISDENEGYQRIDAESLLIQDILKNIPIIRGNVTEEEEGEKYELTAYVHLAPSAPMGSLLSALTGKNIPYIFAELYKEGDLKSSGSVGRLPLGAIELDLEGKKFFELIKTVIGMFDWKNASFFKKIKFPNLENGTYIVKIYRENRLFGKENQYIGFAIVELSKNQRVDIYCRPEGKIKLSIVDQNKEKVENVKFSLQRNNVDISSDITNKNGTVVLKAPVFVNKKYNLKVIYKGFLVNEKQVKLGLINRFKQKTDSFKINYHMLTVNVEDTWGFPPEVSLNPSITSDEMIESTLISPSLVDGGGVYTFSKIYPANYHLNMKYKSFNLENEVTVDSDKNIDLTFPAEFEINVDVMNSYGYIVTDGEISVSRSSKTEKTSIDKDGKAKILVPPGKYEISVFSENEKIAQQTVEIKGNKNIDILSSLESFFNTIVIYLGIIFLVISIIFTLWKKNFYFGLKLLVISLLIISLVSPWWILSGDNGTTETTTKTLLVPPKIISLSSSADVIGGDVSQVPSEVTMILNLLSILIIITCIIIFFTIFIKNRLKRTSKIFSILSLIFLILTIFLFYYVMSIITEVGVGNFIGSGDLEVTLPGIAESQTINCNWGPGIGFYLGFLALIFSFILLFFDKIKAKFFK